MLCSSEITVVSAALGVKVPLVGGSELLLVVV